MGIRLCSFALVLGLSSAATAQQEITLVAPGSVKTALDILLPQFTAKTGTKVALTIGSGTATVKQAAEGTFDASIAQAPFPQVLASSNVDVKNQTPLATIAMAVAVKAGSPKPDISTPAAVKAMLLTAKSIAYSKPPTSASGISFENTLNKLAIADQIHAKAVYVIGGGPGTAMAVAKGDAELGASFQSEMDATPGIDVVGLLPEDISPRLALVGFVSLHAKDPVAAKALLAYLASPAAAAVYKAQGLLPAGK